jgi:hypothetical protein
VTSCMRTDATAATRCSSSSRRSSDRLLPNTRQLLNCGTELLVRAHLIFLLISFFTIAWSTPGSCRSDCIPSVPLLVPRLLW